MLAKTSEYITPLSFDGQFPEKFRDPFDNIPQSLSICAAQSLQNRLSNSSFLSNALWAEGHGKMFGVLVILDRKGNLGYLSSFSGMLNRQWLVPGFVPPVFDIQEQAAILNDGETHLLELSNAIKLIQNDPARLMAIQKLSNLVKQSEFEVSALKQLNQENRKSRRMRRECIDNKDENLELLRELSLSSQNDKKAFKLLKVRWQEKLQKARQRLNNLYENEMDRLKARSRLISQQLHTQVFETYRLQNNLGEVVPMTSLFDGKTPPGGSGDCAAPKLLQFAVKNNLKPLAMAEFWWGGEPSNGIRHHGEFYPPCRGKCHPVLPFLLKGLEIESAGASDIATSLQPSIVYEDGYIIAVDKPPGLLSIPGTQVTHSVSSWLTEHFPKASGPLLVHRLDMSTSGLLLVAKNAQTHKQIQKQFIERKVEKRYLAVLSKPLEPEVRIIRLPIRVDLDDRPRQLVCYEYGKMAETRVEVVSTDSDSTRVYFYPVTGRTHQLRVHAAHYKGLAAPIVGDELYGTRAERLMLHAESLSFCHPHSGKRMTLTIDADF